MSFDQGNSEARATGALPFSAAAGIPSDTLDMALLNAFEELQSDDGSDLIIELIDLYLQDAPQQIIAIRKATAANEWGLLKRAAHNLKGSSGTLGVRHVAQISEKLEGASYPEASDGVAALLQLLEYKFGKAREALAAERQRRLL